ncbi:MAG: hypothetical protein SFX73_33335 [Kofleriaceae bacterium]|nr:hypothetical protein [Kofleriaceae bacterium]
MRALALLLVVAACQNNGGDDDYPIIPSGDDTTIGPPGDAAVIDAGVVDGGNVIEGRVCLLIDPRNLTTCAPMGAGGLAVVIGTESALTGDTGAFTIPTPDGSNLVWRVTGEGIVPSVMALSSMPLIPAFTTADYAELQLDNGILPDPTQGAIFTRILQNGQPLANAVATASPSGTETTLYDSNNPNLWNEGATGALGVAWLPGLGAGATTVTVTPPEGADVAALVPVEQGSVTFATIVVP